MTMRHRGRYTYTFAASLASPADGWFRRAQARCRQWPKRPVKARLEELSVRLSFKYFQNMHEICFEWSSFKRHRLYMIEARESKPWLAAQVFSERSSRAARVLDFARRIRAKRKRPGNRDAPKFQPVRASGSDLGRFDLQKLTGARDWDRPRLHRLRDLAHEAD